MVRYGGVWEAVVLNAIIRGELRAPGGEWNAETVVAALGAIRADPERAGALDDSEPDEVIETFLRTYRSLLDA